MFIYCSPFNIVNNVSTYSSLKISILNVFLFDCLLKAVFLQQHSTLKYVVPWTMSKFRYSLGGENQGGITCGAIDEPRKSSSLSMRSFAIDEPGSSVRALYATLVKTHKTIYYFSPQGERKQSSLLSLLDIILLRGTISFATICQGINWSHIILNEEWYVFLFHLSVNKSHVCVNFFTER